MADIHRVRSELGRFPSRDEYARLGRFPRSAIVESFGSWTMMLQASGIQYSAKGKRDKQEIRKEAFESLLKEAEEKKKIAPPPLIQRLLCISDLHFPYGHPDTISFLFALDDKYKFSHTLIGGDEADFHALSFHDSDADLLSAGHELEAAIKHLDPLYKRFPNAFVLSSNHGDMVYRKGKHHGIPRHVIKSYNEVLRAPPGWIWNDNWTLQFSNGKKAFAAHGISKNYLGASQQLGMSFIQFHFHNELGVRYWAVNGELHWAMQSACLIDDTSQAMAYNKLTFGRPVIGCSGVICGLPVLFPMLLDRHGRWTGEVP